MVDDHTQRPFRSTEPPAPAAPAKPVGKATGSVSGNDPLAELARLIGQNDPFSEFGRDGARRVAAPQPPAPDWHDQPAEFAPPAAPPPNFGRQQFGGAPLASDADLYHVENEAPGYAAAPATQTTVSGYEDDPYHPNNAHLGPAEDDFYDDVQPSRRRMGILVIAGIFALAVLGTAGAFGYRAVFGSSSSSVRPPVIKADSTPSKIVPPSSKDPQSSKQITDRINDKGIGEKLVSREEQPVDVKDKPADAMPPGATPQAQGAAPAAGTGVIGTEPKKVRTIAIHPDQQAAAEPTSASAPPPARVTTATPPTKPAVAAQPPRAVTAEADPEPVPRQMATHVAPSAAPSRNAPLSLSPDAPARPAPARQAASRTAAVVPAQRAPAAANGARGSYAVQVSSQRSEADAQAAFRSLQSKYPGQLGGKQPLIHRVDLGAKGVYYRAMVGPFATGGEASQLCSSLKAAGGSCIIQKN